MPPRTRSSLGTTWAPYYGKWPGIYVPRVGGGAQQRVVPNKRVWSTAAQPSLSGEEDKGLFATFVDNATAPFTTAWNYYVPSAKAPAASAAGPATGIYTEGGYWYRYAAGGRIVLALSPTSKTEREVPAGSAAYKAIFKQISTGVAQVSTKAALAAAKLGAAAPSTTRPTTRRMRVQPEAEISPLPEESIVTRVAQSSWTPWAVGGVIVAGAAFFLLRPRSPGV